MTKSIEFDTAMARLKEIEKSVSSENTSLEECLDLLDESVVLADICVRSVNSGLEESAETSTEESAQDDPSAESANNEPAHAIAEEQETAE